MCRCRAETSVAGRVCRHCRLEEGFLRWEGRAFSLYTKAGAGAGKVTTEEALEKVGNACLPQTLNLNHKPKVTAEKALAMVGGTGVEGEGGRHGLYGHCALCMGTCAKKFE